MSDDRRVIPIGEGALRRAIERRNELASDVVELNRATIGERVFIAERAGVGGRNVWRIRIDGTSDSVEWANVEPMTMTFASLLATESDVLEVWLSSRIAATGGK